MKPSIDSIDAPISTVSGESSELKQLPIAKIESGIAMDRNPHKQKSRSEIFQIEKAPKD
jgi:hypothetical protein